MAQALDAREPEVGRWLWIMEDARSRTLECLDGMDEALLDREAFEGGNSIGSILYHIAAIEADYLISDLLQQPFPQEIIDLFPYDVREENGRLTPIRGFDLAWYLRRLTDVRSRLLAALREMDAADFRRVRVTDWADITPEWTLYHLLHHEARHSGELAAVRTQLERGARGA